jgi:hypothetical protein
MLGLPPVGISRLISPILSPGSSRETVGVAAVVDVAVGGMSVVGSIGEGVFVVLDVAHPAKKRSTAITLIVCFIVIRLFILSPSITTPRSL